MLRFVKGMYEQPDRDLIAFWWDLVEKYQLVRRPDGRFRARLRQQDPQRERARLLPQLHDGAVVRVPGPPRDRPGRVRGRGPKAVLYNDRKEVGDFMRRRVFEPGRSLDWNGLTRHATGET